MLLQSRNSQDNYEKNFYDLKKAGMADGNESGDTMMIEHETRTKLNSPHASSPSPSSPKSSLTDDKTQRKNPDHNGNAAVEDSIVKEKSHHDGSKSAPSTQSMAAMPNAAPFSFQTLMGALGSLPPAMATLAFQSLASMSPGTGSTLPPAVLAALPPEMATIMQQLSAGLPNLGGSQPPPPQNLGSPSSLSSDTVSSYVGDHPNNDRPYEEAKTNNNNDIPVIQSPPLSRKNINLSEDCDEQNEGEGAPDTPPSSIPGRCQ